MEEQEKKINETNDQNEINVNKKCDKKSPKSCEASYKAIIASQEEEIKSLNNKIARIQADSENYRKRLKMEAEEEKKYAISNFVCDLIDPVDQLSKVSNMETQNELLKNFLIGFKMISEKFMTVFRTYGISKIEAIGKEFNPKYHYAAEKIYDPTKKDNTIVAEISSGFVMKDRVIKVASVKVNLKENIESIDSKEIKEKEIKGDK